MSMTLSIVAKRYQKFLNKKVSRRSTISQLSAPYTDPILRRLAFGV